MRKSTILILLSLFLIFYYYYFHFTPDFFVATYQDGTQINIALSLSVVPRFWKELGNWEPESLRVFNRFVDSETVFIDVGAWEGPALLYAVRQAKTVLGVEPDPYSYRALRENIELNPKFSSRISVTEGCISNKKQKYKLSGKGESNSVLGELHQDFERQSKKWGDLGVHEIDCDTLDGFVKDKGVPETQKLFIKLDTEGSEYIILPSLTSWVKSRQVKPIFWVSIHQPTSNIEEKKKDLLQFIHSFQHCGKSIDHIIPCSTIDDKYLGGVFELLLTDKL